MIQLPRLLDSSMAEIVRLQPVSLSIDLNMAPVSTATMQLPEGQPEVKTGAFVELFTPHGSAGIFRVQQASQDCGGVITLNLEHSIVTLSDGLIPGTLEEEKTTTAREALAEILSYQTAWQLGAVEVPEDEKFAWSYDYSNLLESLLSILDKLPAYMATFDQSTTPWVVNVVAVSNAVASECRLSRNISSLSVETDRSELCTRLYVPGLESPLDADTIDTWGTISRSLIGDEGLTADELTAYARKYLDEHKNPVLVVSIDALDLYKATSEPIDAFHLGYMCRVCLPDYGQTINQRIVTISYPDLIADDQQVRITLANAAETASDALAGLIVDTTVQRRILYKNGQEIDRLVVRTIVNEEAIDIITPKLNILAVDVTTQAQRITNIAGTVDTQGNLISGVRQDMDGINQRYSVLVGDVETLNGSVSSITGSALWMNRDNITGVVGNMSVGADGKIYINEGSGLMVYEGGAAYGLYNENNLTAGILVDKINGGTATILGNHVNIEANETFRAQADKLIVIEAGVDENRVGIALANGQITANANAIALKADQASLELANRQITANANAIALKADQASLELANGQITANANAIALKADQASLELANGRIDAQANEIALQANNVLTLEAGVAENKAAIALANGDIALMADNITANANAIALKADQASLDLANGRIDAQANEIALKADKIDLQGYVTATELAAESAKINEFFSGSAVAAKMIVTNLTAISFTFAGNACTWTSTEVVTDVSVNATGEIAVRDADGNIIGTAVTGVRRTQSKEQIYYLTWTA